MAHPGVELVRSLLAGRAEQSLDERRAGLDALGAMLPVPEGAVVEPATLGGRPAEWITPAEARGDGVVLYLHGGAYVSGSLTSHRGIAARLAEASGRQVVTLDYRLAPEHPFPAAVDDAVAAVRELRAAGRSASSLAIAGDSAGGGLVLAALLALRAEGAEQPACAVAISPWADLTQSAPSYELYDELDPMLDRASLQETADLYLAGAAPTDPLASPALGDLAGLPPVMVQVGEVEVLRDDSVRVADALRAAGGEVEIAVVPDVIHVFPAFPYELFPEAEVAVAEMGAFLDRHLP